MPTQEHRPETGPESTQNDPCERQGSEKTPRLAVGRPPASSTGSNLFKAKRISSIGAGIAAQLCLGGIYAFSTFVPAMIGEWGLQPAGSQLLFGGTLFLLTLLTIITGRLLRRYGPRMLIAASGLLFITGYLLISMGGRHTGYLYIGYLAFLGPSMAAGYVTPIASGMLWFPNRRGLVTGVAAAGFGAGGVLQTAVAEKLFSLGFSLSRVLLIIGLVWGLILLLCSIGSFTPPGLIINHRGRERHPSPMHLLVGMHRQFLSIIVLLLFGTLPGLMLIGLIKPIGLSSGLTSAAASAGVAVLAIGNGTGRILWGLTSDRIAPRTTALLDLSGILISCLLFLLFISYPIWFLPASFLLGFCYGGPLVIAPDHTARLFGPDQVGVLYPLAFVFHGAAAVLGAPFSGFLYQVTGGYEAVFLVSALTGGAGLLLYTLITRR